MDDGGPVGRRGCLRGCAAALRCGHGSSWWQTDTPSCSRRALAAPSEDSSRSAAANYALVVRLAVHVRERLDSAHHAEPAPGDLVRARVEAHVVRLARAVD